MISLNLINIFPQNFVQMTNQLSQTLSSKFSDMEEEKDHLLQESNDIINMLSPDLHLNSSAAVEDLQEEQTLINDIVSSEISHDVPTGLWPWHFESSSPVFRLLVTWFIEKSFCCF